MAGCDRRADKRRCTPAHCDNPINSFQRAGELSRLAMQLRGGGTKFEHFASRENPPAVSGSFRKELRQRVQRRWARVVTVINHREAAFKSNYLATLVGGHKSWKNVSCFRRTDTPHSRSRQGRQRIHHVVPSDQRQSQRRPSTWRNKFKNRACNAAFLNFFRAELRTRAGPKPNHIAARNIHELRHALVIYIKD